MKMKTKNNQTAKPVPADIFSKLIGKEIPFIVIVSVNTLRFIKAEYYSRDYTIILYHKDSAKMKPINFMKSDMKLLFEKNLSPREIRLFKNKQELFEKIKHTNDGRIYEVKGKSFKNYFKSQKQKEKQDEK